MRTLYIFVLVAAICYLGYVVLDYYGFHIEMHKPLITAAIAAPIIQAITQVFKRPEKELLNNKNSKSENKS